MLSRACSHSSCSTCIWAFALRAATLRGSSPRATSRARRASSVSPLLLKREASIRRSSADDPFDPSIKAKACRHWLPSLAMVQRAPSPSSSEPPSTRSSARSSWSSSLPPRLMSASSHALTASGSFLEALRSLMRATQDSTSLGRDSSCCRRRATSFAEPSNDDAISAPSRIRSRTPGDGDSASGRCSRAPRSSILALSRCPALRYLRAFFRHFLALDGEIPLPGESIVDIPIPSPGGCEERYKDFSRGRGACRHPASRCCGPLFGCRRRDSNPGYWLSSKSWKAKVLPG